MAKGLRKLSTEQLVHLIGTMMSEREAIDAFLDNRAEQRTLGIKCRQCEQIERILNS